MKYSWTLDELVLVLDFYVTWRSPSKDNELQFADLAELVFPHSKQSVKALIRNYQHLDPKPSPYRSQKAIQSCRMDVECVCRRSEAAQKRGSEHQEQSRGES